MEGLQRLQTNPRNIRNLCILAHVDHGKTSLADSLVASNGIISQRQAGKLRYMDSREDEQVRGITMKSSAIALQYNQGSELYLINLIDSPGHVDFSSEVSTAVRLCDGALVVVDALEGVCSQTKVVLQQAWKEGIKLCLVINKVDKLILQLQLSPTEAYYHLQQILEQVNAVTGSLFSSEVMESVSSKPQEEPVGETEGDGVADDMVYDWSAGLEETDDSSLYFSPEQGNVIFSSALDGWGFSVGHFASMYAEKLGIREAVLHKTLWGDFYLNTKTKRIMKGAQAKGKKPLFVQFVLDNLWAVYKAIVTDRNKEQIDKIVKSMKLKISARDSRHTTPRVHLFAVCSQWLPLSDAVLQMVVHHLPSPLQLSEERVTRLMCSTTNTFQSLPLKTRLLKDRFLCCDVDESAPVIIFVSKMTVMDKTTLPQYQTRPLTEAEIAERREAARKRHQAKMAASEMEGDNMEKTAAEQQEMEEVEEGSGRASSVFLAFSRVFSGTVKRGQRLYVLQPLYDPAEAILHDDQPHPSQDQPLPPHVLEFTVGDLYILMGRGVALVDEIPAGNVVGIAGLGECITKSATISSTLACPAFGAMNMIAAPIVRVAIEPRHASELRDLVQGMKLLNQADPSVEISVQETGEHVLAAAGEVHLQKCLDDLEKEFARVKLRVSEPIIPFRETIVTPPKVDMVNEEISLENEIRLLKPRVEQTVKDPCEQRKEEEEVSHHSESSVTIRTANKACTLHLEARPLPDTCTALFEKSTLLLKALHMLQTTTSREKVRLPEETLTELKELRTKLDTTLMASSSDWEGVVDRIWSFGPRHTGANILVNSVPGYQRPSVWAPLEMDPPLEVEPSRQLEPRKAFRDYDNSIVNGFQLATLSGPLCEEPMHGVCFFLKEWNHITASPSSQRQTGSGGREKGTIDTSSSGGGETGTSNTSGSGDGERGTNDTGEPQEDVKAPPTVDTYGPFSGQLISAMKEGCRRSLLAQPARLMAAMYSSNILATADVLGKVYGVLGRRNGRVLSDEMKEGSAIFSIQALIPVAESFGFAEEIRKRTSGLANPQLIFSHWEVIPNDPFWTPSTEEELLHFGDKADFDNIARKYMNAVRRRKGLHVDEKIVEFGEKQRTLKKNK